MTPAGPLFKGAKSKGTSVLEKSKLPLVGQVKPNSDLGPWVFSKYNMGEFQFKTKTVFRKKGVKGFITD